MEWSGSCLECRCWLLCWCTLSWLVFPNVGEFADTWWNLWNAAQISIYEMQLIRMCYWMCYLGQQVSMGSGNLMLLSSIWVEMTGGHWHTKAQCRDASWYRDISTIHIGLDIGSWRPLSHGTPGEESLIAGFARFLRHLREHRGCLDSDSLGNRFKKLDFDAFDIQDIFRSSMVIVAHQVQRWPFAFCLLRPSRFVSLGDEAMSRLGLGCEVYQQWSTPYTDDFKH